MPQITPDQEFALVNLIYNQIFGAVTGVGNPGLPGGPLQPADETLLILSPNYGIRAEDFTDPYYPGYSAADKAALAHAEASLQHIAVLTDAIPFVNSLWADSGHTVSEGYRLVVNADVKAPQPDPALVAQYNQAYAYLHTTVTTTNALTGQQETRTGPSASYAAYISAAKDYNDAFGDYLKQYNNYQATLQGQQQWPLVEPYYHAKVDDAWNAWIAANKNQVEDAMAAMATASQNVIGKIFQDDQHEFEENAPITIGLGTKVLQTIILPTDWTEDTAGWTAVSVNQGDVTSTTTSDLTSIGGGLGFTYGIFYLGADGDYSKQQYHTHSTSSNLQINYEALTVQYYRPWFDGSLLLLKGWSVPGEPEGFLSSGKKDATSQQGRVMPLIPMGFVAVRKVVITADWSEQDKELISHAIDIGGTLCIGPFQINGSYKHNDTKDTQRATWDGATLSVPGMQVLGFITRVVNEAPPPPAAPAAGMEAAEVRPSRILAGFRKALGLEHGES